jgi:adenine-specific DNA-methyltransferase
MRYDFIQTIRYMGTKGKLLDNIIPEIIGVTPKHGTVCDIMAGSNAVSYALKGKFTVYTNDVQKYSYVISVALIENQKEDISRDRAFKELKKDYENNLKIKAFSFFLDNYKDTYFSKEQCLDIDSIRYAIELCNNRNLKHLYLSALMGAMCKIQSTPGHFAQFMPKNHYRILELRKLNLWYEFLKKCNDYRFIVFTDKNNRCFCEDYNFLLKKDLVKNVDTIYLDSPYNQEQYSRFYHILETVCKYDSPKLSYKARYRDDRFKSKFCYKKTVKYEFKNIIDYCLKNTINLVISYSNKGVLNINELILLCNDKFKNVYLKENAYKHSTQGKGNTKIKEYTITCLV